MAMEQALILAQTLFYFAVSLAIIVVGVLTAAIFYYLLSVARSLRRIADNLGDASEDIKEKIEDILEQLSQVPFLSSFIKNKKSSKGRGKK